MPAVSLATLKTTLPRSNHRRSAVNFNLHRFQSFQFEEAIIFIEFEISNLLYGIDAENDVLASQQGMRDITRKTVNNLNIDI
jgi:hypothetical protein